MSRLSSIKFSNPKQLRHSHNEYFNTTKVINLNDDTRVDKNEFSSQNYNMNNNFPSNKTQSDFPNINSSEDTNNINSWQIVETLNSKPTNQYNTNHVQTDDYNFSYPIDEDVKINENLQDSHLSNLSSLSLKSPINTDVSEQSSTHTLNESENNKIENNRNNNDHYSNISPPGKQKKKNKSLKKSKGDKSDYNIITTNNPTSLKSSSSSLKSSSSSLNAPSKVALSLKPMQFIKKMFKSKNTSLMSLPVYIGIIIILSVALFFVVKLLNKNKKKMNENKQLTSTSKSHNVQIEDNTILKTEITSPSKIKNDPHQSVDTINKGNIPSSMKNSTSESVPQTLLNSEPSTNNDKDSKNINLLPSTVGPLKSKNHNKKKRKNKIKSKCKKYTYYIQRHENENVFIEDENICKRIERLNINNVRCDHPSFSFNISIFQQDLDDKDLNNTSMDHSKEMNTNVTSYRDNDDITIKTENNNLTNKKSENFVDLISFDIPNSSDSHPSSPLQSESLPNSLLYLEDTSLLPLSTEKLLSTVLTTNNSLPKMYDLSNLLYEPNLPPLTSNQNIKNSLPDFHVVYTHPTKKLYQSETYYITDQNNVYRNIPFTYTKNTTDKNKHNSINSSVKSILNIENQSLDLQKDKFSSDLSVFDKFSIPLVTKSNEKKPILYPTTNTIGTDYNVAENNPINNDNDTNISFNNSSKQNNLINEQVSLNDESDREKYNFDTEPIAPTIDHNIDNAGRSFVSNFPNYEICNEDIDADAMYISSIKN